MEFMKNRKANKLGTLIALCLSAAFANSARAQSVQVPGLCMPLGWAQSAHAFQVNSNGISITAAGRTYKYIWSGGDSANNNAPQLVFDDSDEDFVFSFTRQGHLEGRMNPVASADIG